jgi:hypothetical protein
MDQRKEALLRVMYPCGDPIFAFLGLLYHLYDIWLF